MSEEKKDTKILMRERQWLLDEKYAGVETLSYFADLSRLESGEPLAYLIGHVPFLETTIFLDSRPLIPRPETEYWVAQAIVETQTQKKPLSVLDLCAGSGCIGVAVLKGVPMARIDFCEIDAGHRKTIIKNLSANNIDSERAHTYGGDLFTEIAKVDPQYDFILSNPPYIDPARISRVEKSVTEYEPSQSLFGGIDGMEYITRILTETPDYLSKKGILYIEHEPEQRDAIHALAQLLSYASCETYRDQYRIDRYTRLVRAK
jgi:HemK-like putative methylase